MSHPNSKSKTSLATLFPFSMRDLIVTALILFVAVAFCILLQRLDPSAGFATPVFVLTVLLTSRLTTGYFWGLFSAVLGVIAVNFFFTFPYWAFNLTITGYPLSFLTFLSVSVITSALTTKTRQLDKLRMENEKIRMRADLLRSVSHDIRTPLTGIVGATNVLLEQDAELTPQQRRELLQNANEEAQWLIHIVENLLSITRIGAGEDARVTKTPEAAEEVIEGAVGKFRRSYPQIDVRVDLPEDFFLVPMDPLLIQQVLTNLLENAAVHGVTTTQVTVSLEKRGRWARFTVEDNGRGIPELRLHNLFDGTQSAQQGDSTRSMGIGLSVCKTVVAAHRGKIKGENKKGGGARFTVDLPLEEEEHEDQG